MKHLPVACALVALSFSFGCGAVADPADDPHGPTGSQDAVEAPAAPAGDGPFVRTAYCERQFADAIPSCERNHGVGAGPRGTDPTAALPADFPPAPRELTYCGGDGGQALTADHRWTLAGAPDEVEAYYEAALGAAGYEHSTLERASFAPCAEAISFSKPGVGFGYLGFALGFDPEGVTADATMVGVTFTRYE